ncbi:hypothetical protein L6164_017212 [Bauhinia variegata]|uniref:Uncharacterized protein n=1 Tax=Bauhinia variegata TaxID=167791 RepID=A0ACB9N763_BAUVA|nr:hypothetical protein L6164_017212 [Bauhinia variegata]
MAASYLPFGFMIVSLCVFSNGGIFFTEALNGGFSVELIHRDSPKSPFYNPKETPFDKVTKALRRSINRANHFFPSSAVSTDSAESDVIPNHGEYLMSYSVGTPPFEILGIADTGSDLIWSQCQPCTQCYNQTGPLFDPKKSSTYRNLPCSSEQCQSLEQPSCSSDGCHYSYQYGDQSYSMGNLALDTIQLDSTTGRPVAFPKAIIGCGHQNGGTFDKKGSGIVGLGGGSLSLITQMGSSVSGKFSYCLVPLLSKSNATSELNFGQNAAVSGSGTVSTPLMKKDPDTFYYLTLNGFSVGTKRLNFEANQTSSKAVQEGNIIIDSGTTLTLLPVDLYSDLESQVKAQIKQDPVQDPSGLLSLCYRASSGTFNAPVITAHFDGGDVVLNPLNTFIAVSEDVVCFAFSTIEIGAIFGNIAQMNFLVGYDIENKAVSFKPADCTKL